MSGIKEFIVDSRDYFSKAIHLVKEFLNNNKTIKLVANSKSAGQATRLSETLKREGYIEVQDIQTETSVKNDNRQTKLIITIHVTSNFDNLYKESKEKDKKKEEEKEKKNETKP